MRRDLRRRQPVDDRVEADSALQPAGDEHEVLVLAAHAVLGLRRQAVDRRAAEPADEVEVVRREVLHDADVAHAVGERPDALGRDQEDVAELPVTRRARAASISAGLQRSTCPTAARTPAASHGADDLAALLDGRGERLLDQQVHAGRRRAARTARGAPRSAAATTAKSSGRLPAARRSTRRRARGRARRRSGPRPGRRRRRTRRRAALWSRRAWWRPIMPSPRTAPRSTGRSGRRGHSAH